MDKIDKKFFYSNFPFRPLSQSQVNAIDFILDSFDSDDDMVSLRWLAYILATVKHETAETYEPVTEAYYLKPESKRISALTRMYRSRSTIIRNGEAYFYGRGYVQLTHDYNYKSMTRKFGVDFYNNPDKALEPVYAIKIMFYGMLFGSFTGKRLSNYFNDSKTDWVNARRIINGLDRANLIGSYARKFYGCLKFVEEPTAHKAINERLPDPALEKAEAEQPTTLIT